MDGGRTRRERPGARGTLTAMDVRMFTVGAIQENCYLLRRQDRDDALIVDPGEEAPKLLGAIEALGEILGAILLTWHNLHTYQQLMADMRAAIAEGSFELFQRRLRERAAGDAPA